jgi:hypothetical protein
MIIRFWHYKPFQTDLRGIFELPEWPYAISDNGPCPPGLKSFLQDLGVVRLEVERKPNKLIIPVPPESEKYELGEWPNKWKEPWNGFTTFGDFHEDTLMIKSWDRNHPNWSRLVGSKVPDAFAWYEWNKSVTVKVMDSTGVLYG